MKDQFTSKRNIIIVAFILVFTVGLFGGMATLVAIRMITDWQKGAPLNKGLLMVPILFYSFTLYTLYHLATYLPKVRIDLTGITLSTWFKTKTYHWEDIHRIQLTGKQNYSFLFMSTPVEATTIRLKEGRKLYLWVDYYRNTPALRTILNRANSILRESKPMTELTFDIHKPNEATPFIDENTGNVFKGNAFLSVHGMLFCLWVLLITSMIIYRFPTNYSGLIIIFLATLFMGGLFSYQCHYFIITPQFLVVKNSIWFWRKRVYWLADIQEIVIEEPPKRSISLRIITKDFQDKLYSALGLTPDDWKELILQLQKDKIKIRNEAIKI